MRVPVNRPLITKDDADSVIGALESGNISGNSAITKEVELRLSERLLGRPVISLSSGTVACDLATHLAGVGKGDLVLAPAATIISTISEAARRGAKIQLVDHDPDTWCPDYTRIDKGMLKNIKAVYVAHLYGLTAFLGNLRENCLELGVPLIEDAAEVFGQTYDGQPCGTLGDFGVFSFYSNKVITSGEGGALAISDPQTAEKARGFRNLCFGEDERLLHFDLGWNYRMGSLQSALLLSQITRLDGIIENKVKLASMYNQAFANHPLIQTPLETTFSSSNHYWVYGIVLRDVSGNFVKNLRQKLFKQGIETRRFFPPLYLQPALLARQAVGLEKMPVAEQIWEQGIILPFGSGITESEIQYVSEIITSLLT